MCSAINEKGQTEEQFLNEYDQTKYPYFAVTADIAVFAHCANGGVKLLLIKRRNHPFIGKWALPGGFVEPDENLEQAAARELYEETSIKGITPHQLRAFGNPNRDPRARIVTVAFTVEVDFDKVKATAGDDAAQAEWYDVKVGETVTRNAGGGLIEIRLKGKDESFIIKAVKTDGIYKSTSMPLLASDHSDIITYAVAAVLGL